MDAQLWVLHQNIQTRAGPNSPLKLSTIPTRRGSKRFPSSQSLAVAVPKLLDLSPPHQDGFCWRCFGCYGELPLQSRQLQLWGLVLFQSSPKNSIQLQPLPKMLTLMQLVMHSSHILIPSRHILRFVPCSYTGCRGGFGASQYRLHAKRDGRAPAHSGS